MAQAFKRSLREREVGHRLLPAAAHGRDVVRQRRLLLGGEAAQVDLLALLPDVGLEAPGAAVVGHALQSDTATVTSTRVYIRGITLQPVGNILQK